MKRHKMSKYQSKRTFKRGAMHIHGKNATITPMRGGFRL